ncbi:hypothetical protein HN873_070160 [Arachis hypogaea]
MTCSHLVLLDFFIGMSLLRIGNVQASGKILASTLPDFVNIPALDFLPFAPPPPTTTTKKQSGQSKGCLELPHFLQNNPAPVCSTAKNVA